MSTLSKVLTGVFVAALCVPVPQALRNRGAAGFSRHRRRPPLQPLQLLLERGLDRADEHDGDAVVAAREVREERRERGRVEAAGIRVERGERIARAAAEEEAPVQLGCVQ